MSFELTGKLIEKFDTQKISDSFQKREFVVETTENANDRVFTEQIKFQLLQDKCGLIDDFNINDEVKVHFNIKGRKWEKGDNVNYFTNLDAWRIEKAGDTPEQSSPPPIPQQGEAPLPSEPDFLNSDDEDDDLPF